MGMGKWCVPWKSSRRLNVLHHLWCWLAWIWTYSFNIHTQAVFLRLRLCGDCFSSVWMEWLGTMGPSESTGWESFVWPGSACTVTCLSAHRLHGLYWLGTDTYLVSATSLQIYTTALCWPSSGLSTQKKDNKNLCAMGIQQKLVLYFLTISFSYSDTHREGTISTSIKWIAWHFDLERMKAFRNSPIKVVLIITKCIY